MHRLFLAALAFLFSAGAAFAYDTPAALLKALYVPYFKGDNFDWTKWDEAKFRSAALNALFDKDDAEKPDGSIGRLDFDPYIDGQDYRITKFKIGTPAITGDTATVEVTFDNFDTPDALTFMLVKEADGWKVDDVVSADKNFPYSLKAIMQAPLD